jgi:CheY-like chemotaxis protein
LAVSLDRVRFLLVDDNVHMMNIVKTMLRGFGATAIFEAKSVSEALDRLRNDAPDIMILDYLIGDEDGVSFMQRLRTDPQSPAPYTPVVMLTAHSERTRVEAARDAGVNEFCTKPVTATDLLRKIGAIIDNPRPFVRSGSFAGPDRRRRSDPNFRNEDRRMAGRARD